MRTRLLILLAVPLLARAADPARDAASVITEVAAALTAGNVQEFMAPFDAAFPGRDRLRENVAALAAQGDTQSYLEVTSNEGSATERTLQVSWDLRVQRSSEALPYARREVNVTCKLQLRGKRWVIVDFAPVDFLAP
jgi:hypothetical protein